MYPHQVSRRELRRLSEDNIEGPAVLGCALVAAGDGLQQASRRLPNVTSSTGSLGEGGRELLISIPVLGRRAFVGVIRSLW